MKDPDKKEWLVHFLNLPAKEQMMFILNHKLENHLRDKYQAFQEKENNN
jgi:hypothetical protein